MGIRSEMRVEELGRSGREKKKREGERKKVRGKNGRREWGGERKEGVGAGVGMMKGMEGKKVR